MSCLSKTVLQGLVFEHQEYLEVLLQRRGKHTCEEIFDLSDQASQLLVALVNLVFGSVGLHQDILGAELRLIRLHFHLQHLRRDYS